MTFQEFLSEVGADQAQAQKIRRLIRDSEYKKNLKIPMFGEESIEGDVPAVLAFVKSKLEAETKAAEAEEKAEQEFADAIAGIMITSGHSFEGYKITRYSGYISGDDATFMPLLSSFSGGEKQANEFKENLLDAYARIRRNSLQELKEAAYSLGCNAVIGLDFDYMNTDIGASLGSNMPFVLSVTANGTAVVIEKE